MTLAPSRNFPWFSNLLFGAALLVLAGCATVPVTGRTQLNMVSDEELVALADQNYAAFISFARRKDLVASPGHSPQAASALVLIQRVSNRIIDAAGIRNKYKWEITLVKAREPNAFVMPNGKIVVFTGLLPIAKNEAGLAAVIGHEVAHVVARHQAERVSQVLLAQTAIIAADAVLATGNSRNRAVIAAALGLGVQYGLLLPFSREHESEADHIGLLYMAKAGYDPAEAIALWERLEKSSGSGPWEFASTHPSPSTRQSQLRAWLPEAQLFYGDRTRPLPANLAELTKTTREVAAHAALAPLALRPSYQPGFWYRTRRPGHSAEVTFRYERKETCPSGECLVVVASDGSSMLLTQELGVFEQREPDGRWWRFTPALSSIRWPMRVGESWTDDVLLEDSAGKRANTRTVARVAGYESVTVPAGTYMAHKVVVSINGVRFQEVWYSADTQTVIRSITYGPTGQLGSELVDFDRSHLQ